MKNKKRVAASLALLMAANVALPLTAEAKTFKDVGKDHWAYKFVDVLSDKGIINGYEDGTFKPDVQLSYSEMLSLLAGIKPLSKDEMVEASKKYSKLISDVGLNSEETKWVVQPALTVLYREIVKSDELQKVSTAGLLKAGTSKKIPRALAVIYLGRAVGIDAIANAKPFATLPYKDKETIPAGYEKMISTMVELGILAKDGDGEGYFKGNSSLRRSEAATLMYKAYEYVDKNGSTKIPEKKPEVKTESISGYIVSMSPFNEQMIVGIASQPNTSAASSIRIEPSTSLSVNGQSAKASDLKLGMKVTVVYNLETKGAVSLKADRSQETGNARIANIDLAKRELTIETGSGSNDFKTFKLDRDLKVTVNGKTAQLSDLSKGDEIKYVIVDGVITEISASSFTGKIIGAVISALTQDNNGVYRITVKEKDKSSERTFNIDNNAYIFRKKDRARVTDLRVGDEVDMQVTNGLATDITAYVSNKLVDAYIVSIIQEMNKPVKIVLRDIKDSSGKSDITASFAPGAIIKIDSSYVRENELKVGQRVQANIEGGEITEINADSRVRKDFVVGRITYIERTGDYAEIEVVSSSIPSINGMRDLRVRMNTGAIQVNFRVGDNIIASGEYNGAYFFADSIMPN